MSTRAKSQGGKLKFGLSYKIAIKNINSFQSTYKKKRHYSILLIRPVCLEDMEGGIVFNIMWVPHIKCLAWLIAPGYIIPWSSIYYKVPDKTIP